MSLLTASQEKHRHKTASFWAGSPVGSVSAEVRAIQGQKELQAKMGAERIKTRYAELKARPP